MAKGDPADKVKTKSRREYARHASKIPVRVEVVHAWKGSAGTPLSGNLLDVSRGGASLHLNQVLPPRTSLRVVMATAIPGLSLVAEVIWTPLEPRREGPGRMYGLRWRQQLSEAQFTALRPLLAPLASDAALPAP